MRGLKHFAAAVFAFVATSAFATSIWAGTLTVDTYHGIAGGGGAQINAHYSDIGDCCAGDVEYLQLIQLTDPTTGLPKPIPADPAHNDVGWQATFIDPQYQQGTGTFDQEPWYDFTYPDNTYTNPNGGPGPYFNDSPSGWKGDAPLSFSATTLVVCVEDDTITILGGFTWGFTVLNNNPPPGTTTTLHPLAAIDPMSQALADTFNSALDGFYDNLPNSNPQYAENPYTVDALSSDDECCALTVYVPTPSAFYGVPICLAGLAACRRWSKAAA